MDGQLEFNVVVNGKHYTEIPDDLFIPPEALEVLLDSFSGPLDLLLYLIRKQNIDILDIPIMTITQQYLRYIQLMEYRNLELAADYLLMASVLAEIKSRMLLPRVTDSEEDEGVDPRLALVKQLQAYEEIKQAALFIDALPRQDRDTFIIHISSGNLDEIKSYPEVNLEDLVSAMEAFLKKEECLAHHEISREILSVRERMGSILIRLQEKRIFELAEFFSKEEGRQGLIVSLLAILELARQSLLIITQTQPFSRVYVQAGHYE